MHVGGQSVSPPIIVAGFPQARDASGPTNIQRIITPRKGKKKKGENTKEIKSKKRSAASINVAV
jgi:hypothetical protein